MAVQRSDRRSAWLTLGFVAGLAMAAIWPHEPLQAVSSDRNEKFAIITTPVSLESEAVFVVDFLTGRLTGARLGRTRQGTSFINFYFRNLAEDFKVDAGGDPFYAVTAGGAEIQNRGGAQWGQTALYVAELNSGAVGAYAIPYTVSQIKQPPVPLFPIDTFQFREQNVTQ
ncbi:MAG: hypothetical protein ACYTGL_20565 [Planctomycetota bacterium]|jgi:hypothetical protein